MDSPDTGGRRDMADPWDAGVMFLLGFMAGLAGGLLVGVTLVLL